MAFPCFPPSTGETIKVFNITPFAKPRMTQRDRWTMARGNRHRARKCVLDWMAWREEVIWQADGFEMPKGGYHVIFVMPMPRSWSLKKRQEMEGQPHQQTPDKDNLEKALLDALCPGGDADIWDGRCTKIWGKEGQIIIKVPTPADKNLKEGMSLSCDRKEAI